MSFEKEKSLLGALMAANNNESDIASYVINQLKPTSFSSTQHAEIFKAIRQLSTNDSYFDNLTVSSVLSDNNLVSFTDVDLCYQHRCDVGLVRQYANDIKSEAVERYSLAKLSDIGDILSNKENGTIEARLGLAESVINSILESLQNKQEKGLRDGGYWANAWIDEKESYHRGDHVSYELGIKDIDEEFKPKGVLPGSLVVVGARPKMGKTFLAVKMADHFIKTYDKSVCLFSLEMRGQEIWERMLSSNGKINSDRFYSEELAPTSTFWDRAGKLNCDLANSNIHLDDSGGVTINHIKREVRKVHRNKPVSMIMVDYLTLMDGDASAERNDLKFGAITKALKNLAKELECVVVLLTQLNRNLENRADKKPKPSDSRDTGQIEQDCDVWLGIYREKVYNENCGHDYTEVICELNRAGNNAHAFLRLDNGYFEDCNKEQAILDIERNKPKEKQDESFREKREKRTRI